ncbi:hypothetical protein IM543_17980 [Massilia sp. UMI-21]|nr:hypothetical protein IM543_17980 [Massilia sp. UMI-21]
MSERQRRTDTDTAKVVTRGVNILMVRDRAVARNYMEHMHVPPDVIVRVLDQPGLRRTPSAEQLISEAIVPFPPQPLDD